MVRTTVDTDRMGTTPNRVLAIVVGACVVIAVLAAVFAATRPSARFGGGTPEVAVQGYLRAVMDGDSEKAAGFLAPDTACGITDLDRVDLADSARVSLVDSATDGTMARVRVRVSFSMGGGPFETANSENQTFRLTRSSGKWLLSGVPWPLFECGVSVR
jgi:hypothetical protein